MKKQNKKVEILRTQPFISTNSTFLPIKKAKNIQKSDCSNNTLTFCHHEFAIKSLGIGPKIMKCKKCGFIP